MPRRAAGLTAAKVRTAAPGTYTDGGGLMLAVQPSGAATWVMRYSFGGKRRDMGLRPARGIDAVSLADARQLASNARAQIRQKLDPIEERRAAHEAQMAVDAPVPEVMTFAEVAESYLAAHEPGWRNTKHRAQWRMTLTEYAGPILGAMPIDAISTPDVLAVLKPLWLTTPGDRYALAGKDRGSARLRGRERLAG